VRLAGFIIGELAIVALLAALLFISLLYQPAWLWIAAPLIVLAGLVVMFFVTKSNRRLAWILAFVCPVAYTAHLLALGLSTQGISPGFFLTVIAYYAIGVGLFSAHFWLNAKVRPGGA
jgi:hypothetical protein